jgi:hypothetical protein
MAAVNWLLPASVGMPSSLAVDDIADSFKPEVDEEPPVDRLPAAPDDAALCLPTADRLLLLAQEPVVSAGLPLAVKPPSLLLFAMSRLTEDRRLPRRVAVSTKLMSDVDATTTGVDAAVTETLDESTEIRDDFLDFFDAGPCALWVTTMTSTCGDVTVDLTTNDDDKLFLGFFFGLTNDTWLESATD